MCIYRSTSAIDYSNLWFVRGHTSTARFRFLWSQLFLMRPWALQAPTKRLCSPPQGQGTWSMPTVNKIGWARWTSNGSTVESGPGGKIITFAFNNTRFAFTFTEVTKELLPSACVSSICIFPFLPCPGYMLNHKFTSKLLDTKCNGAKLETFNKSEKKPVHVNYGFLGGAQTIFGVSCWELTKSEKSCMFVWKHMKNQCFTNLYCHRVLARRSPRRQMSCPTQT